MKLNCICCGHTVDLRDAYDEYDGLVRCMTCGALLAIHTHEGQVKLVERAAAQEHHEKHETHEVVS